MFMTMTSWILAGFLRNGLDMFQNIGWHLEAKKEDQIWSRSTLFFFITCHIDWGATGLSLTPSNKINQWRVSAFPDSLMRQKTDYIATSHYIGAHLNAGLLLNAKPPPVCNASFWIYSSLFHLFHHLASVLASHISNLQPFHPRIYVNSIDCTSVNFSFAISALSISLIFNEGSVFHHDSFLWPPPLPQVCRKPFQTALYYLH